MFLFEKPTSVCLFMGSCSIKAVLNIFLHFSIQQPTKSIYKIRIPTICLQCLCVVLTRWQQRHRMYQQNKSPQQQVVAPLKQQQPPLKQQQPLQMWLLRQRLPHQTPRRKLLQRTPQWNLLPRRTPRRRVLPPLPLQPQPPRHQHRCRRSPPTRWWRVVRRVS